MIVRTWVYKKLVFNVGRRQGFNKQNMHVFYDVAEEEKCTSKVCVFVVRRQEGFAKSLVRRQEGFAKNLAFVVGGRQWFTQHLAFLMSDQDNEGREGREMG